MLRAVLTSALISCLIGASAEARKAEEPVRATSSSRYLGPTDGSLFPDPRFAIAAANTTVLASYTFDANGVCDPQGWTVHDGTAQIANFWHVEDFAGANVNPGDSLAVLAGSQSLWCGARPAETELTCGYLSLPGYGNNWEQVWQTKTCIPVVGDLDVSFIIETDAEEAYDATYLEYTTDCTGPVYSDWVPLDGGIGVWDGIHDATTHTESYPGVPSSVKVRLRFHGDPSFSDQDDLYDSHAGPVVIDNLAVEGLALEDFEDETVGDTASDDWESHLIPGYGASYLALFPGWSVLQEDACTKNLSCLWAAISGSTETYECGGFPQQAAVPRANSEGQYLDAQIWSPPIPLSGAGNVINLEFAVYRDLPFDNFVFYQWAVRSVSATGCGGRWRDRNFIFDNGGGPEKQWHMDTFPVGDLVDLSQPSIQVQLGVVDMCRLFCYIGGPPCHSHAPLFDNVRVYRVDLSGPTFSVREMDQFQDTFPTDGSDSGTGRADAAISFQSSTSSTNTPADSATIICRDGITAYSEGDPVTGDRSGLAVDPVLGGWQIYCWVRVIDSGVPQVAGSKFGAGLQELPQYPFKDTQVADGKTWTRIRCDRAVNVQSRWRIDFPDALFEAGDVVEYFFGATSTPGLTSYCSGASMNFVQTDADVAAAAPAEFTILPLEPGPTGADILYVDGMDGRGAQVYWDTALEYLGLNADRYDVRAPASRLGNRPDGRVTNVIAQLNGNYKQILWECGDLETTLGDGTIGLPKTDDYDLLNTFLANLPVAGGVYIGGDDVATSLNGAVGTSAATFKSTYITYDLTSDNAHTAYGIAPVGTGMPVGGGGQGAFSGDTWVVYGGCPGINDFDVMEPMGSSVLQSTYGPSTGDNGAEISQITGNARVLLGGYSFMSIRDDEEDGIIDRGKHLYGILCATGDCEGWPTSAASIAVDRLEQNYPNPFNPQTTIAFSIKQRARVKIDVYNVAGQRIRTLLDETRGAGSYTDVRWDGTDTAGSPVASGVYFYKLAAAGFTQTRKMVLLK